MRTRHTVDCVDENWATWYSLSSSPFLTTSPLPPFLPSFLPLPPFFFSFFAKFPFSIIIIIIIIIKSVVHFYTYPDLM